MAGTSRKAEKNAKSNPAAAAVQAGGVVGVAMLTKWIRYGLMGLS